MLSSTHFDSLKDDPSFLALVKDRVGTWLRQQGVISNVPTSVTSDATWSPPQDSCRADAHELSCGNCGSFDVVCQPFASDLQPFTPMTTMNNNHDMDLTNVVNLKLLSPYQIRTMETATRDSLKLKLKDEDIVGLDVVRLAALNPLNKTVDYLGEEDTIDRVSSVAKFQGYLDDRSWVGDRYYLIFRGRDFTGVVRGLRLHEDHELPKSIAHSGGQAFDSRVDAEYAWLQGYYAGICGKVCKAVVDPDVPLFLQS